MAHGPPTVQSSGRPLKVLKQSANNFSGDVIPGRYRPLWYAGHLGENFCFCKVSWTNNKRFCCCSLHFTVLLTFRFTCFHANQWTLAWINHSNKHFHLLSVTVSSVATSDVSTSELMFWEKFLMSAVLATSLMLTEVPLLLSTFPLLLGWKEVRFTIFSDIGKKAFGLYETLL